MSTVERIPEQAVEQAKHVDLRRLAERYTTLSNCAGQKELEGPCPKCGGENRFHCQADWFFCRTCHTKRGDSIEFVRWLQPGLSFAEAVQQLAGGGLPAAVRRQAVSKPAQQQPADWRAKGERLAAEACARLWLPEGEPGRAYLESRGLEAATWQAYGLGFTANAMGEGAAIALPWRVGGEVVAIRYRLLKPTGAQKIISEGGSKYSKRLFGGQQLEPGTEAWRSLIVVEGELNCCSIWQAAHETGLDVLSLGSESAGLSEAAVERLLKYKQLFVWADKGKIAKQLAEALPGAYAVASPAGKDANDLLQAGLLAGFLASMRVDAARNFVELEGLLWALWDAANLPAGVDTGTAAVIGRLAGKLGKGARLTEIEPGRWVAGGE